MVVSEIGKMNRDQLYQFIQHCQSLTTTNCWWVEYEMKDLLISIAENERDLKAAEQSFAPDGATVAPAEVMEVGISAAGHGYGE